MQPVHLVGAVARPIKRAIEGNRPYHRGHAALLFEML
jgi:hypothetical protein